MEMPMAPPDPTRKRMIDKLAQFVIANGAEFEKLTRSRQKLDPKFAFLLGGEYSDYYDYRKRIELAALKKNRGSRPGTNNGVSADGYDAASSAGPAGKPSGPAMPGTYRAAPRTYAPPPPPPPPPPAPVAAPHPSQYQGGYSSATYSGAHGGGYYNTQYPQPQQYGGNYPSQPPGSQVVDQPALHQQPPPPPPQEEDGSDLVKVAQEAGMTRQQFEGLMAAVPTGGDRGLALARYLLTTRSNAANSESFGSPSRHQSAAPSDACPPPESKRPRLEDPSTAGSMASTAPASTVSPSGRQQENGSGDGKADDPAPKESLEELNQLKMSVKDNDVQFALSVAEALKKLGMDGRVALKIKIMELLASTEGGSAGGGGGAAEDVGSGDGEVKKQSAPNGDGGEEGGLELSEAFFVGEVEKPTGPVFPPAPPVKQQIVPRSAPLMDQVEDAKARAASIAKVAAQEAEQMRTQQPPFPMLTGPPPPFQMGAPSGGGYGVNSAGGAMHPSQQQWAHPPPVGAGAAAGFPGAMPSVMPPPSAASMFNGQSQYPAGAQPVGPPAAGAVPTYTQPPTVPPGDSVSSDALQMSGLDSDQFRQQQQLVLQQLSHMSQQQQQQLATQFLQQLGHKPQQVQQQSPQQLQQQPSLLELQMAALGKMQNQEAGGGAAGVDQQVQGMGGGFDQRTQGMGGGGFDQQAPGMGGGRYDQQMHGMRGGFDQQTQGGGGFDQQTEGMRGGGYDQQMHGMRGGFDQQTQGGGGFDQQTEGMRGGGYDHQRQGSRFDQQMGDEDNYQQNGAMARGKFPDGVSRRYRSLPRCYRR